MAGQASSGEIRTAGLRAIRLLWILVLVLGVGVLARMASRYLATEPSGRRATGAAIEPDRWLELAQALEEEVAAREELAREVAELREALAASRPLREPPASDRTSTGAEPLEPAAADRDAAGVPGPQPGFDIEALTVAGLHPSQAAMLRERWEAHELDKLYLRDQAAREGWMTSPRHRQAQEELTARLREELGEDDYAALLYASGSTNAVVVTDVLESSPAGEAGLEQGDEIVRYDGARIFQPQDLRSATTSGEAGQFVPVELMRGDRSRTLYLPRGPLGVMLRGSRRAPSP